MVPHPPENKSEKTCKKTGLQGREDACQDDKTGIATLPSFKQKGASADNTTGTNVPDGSTEVPVQGKNPIDGAVESNVPVDPSASIAGNVRPDRGSEFVAKSGAPVEAVNQGAEVVVEHESPVESCVDRAVESSVPVDPSCHIAGNIKLDRGSEFAAKPKCQADAKKREAQLGNSAFQHFYANRKFEGSSEISKTERKDDCECEKCVKVKKIIDHKKFHKGNSETIDCFYCQLFDGIALYHKNVCKLVYCDFCRSIKENENVDAVRTRPVSQDQDETIIAIIAPISDEITLKIGDRFIEGEDYELKGELGQGGNGVICDVELLQTDLAKLVRKCGIRLVAKRTNATKNEIKALKELRNARYVAPHSFFVRKHQRVHWFNKRTKEDELKAFEHLLFMKRADYSLKDYVKKFSDRVLPIKDAVIYFWQVVTAVNYAHSRGITHNDIKAANVLMFRGRENSFVAHLCDFEYATIKGYPSERRGGTKFFMPPENDDGPARDIHALGILFLEITVGFRFFRNDWFEQKKAMVVQLKDKLHQEIGILIEACVHEQRSKRPDIKYLLDRLNQIGGDEGWWPVCSKMIGL